MELLQVLAAALTGTLLNLLRLCLILVPVLILIEVSRYYRVIERIAAKVQGALRLLTLPPEAAFPLLVGIIFGIVFGAALIIDSAREGRLSKRDLILIGVFLSISHAVVEDTFIYSAFGANPAVLLLTRTGMAVIITRLAAFLIDRRTVPEIKDGTA